MSAYVLKMVNAPWDRVVRPQFAASSTPLPAGQEACSPGDGFGDFGGGAGAIDGDDGLGAVPLEDGSGELVVGAEAAADHFFAVVVAGDERGAIVVADAFDSRGVRDDVVDVETGGTLAAGGQSGDQQLVGDIEMDDDGLGPAALAG